MAKMRMFPSSPALVLEDGGRRHLAVTDVHVGFEAGLFMRDVRPDMRGEGGRMAGEILSICKKSGADSLVLLGDVKSGTGSITSAEWRSVPEFFETLGGIETALVPGNHDGNISRLIPEDVSVSGKSGLVIGDALLTHGHAMPAESFGAVSEIVMGHVHPTYLSGDSVLNGTPVWVRLRAKRESIFPSGSGSIGITVMPSFNSHLRPVRKRASKTTSPILRRALEGLLEARIVSMDGTILGGESELHAVI